MTMTEKQIMTNKWTLIVYHYEKIKHDKQIDTMKKVKRKNLNVKLLNLGLNYLIVLLRFYSGLNKQYY